MTESREPTLELSAVGAQTLGWAGDIEGRVDTEGKDIEVDMIVDMQDLVDFGV
jgi:hypothetical protein